MFRTAFFLTTLLLSAATAFSQAAAVKPLGWDLTYADLFERNKVASADRIRGVSRPEVASAISRILEDLKDENVVSAVLIEHQTIGSVGMTALFFVRTKRAAYFWEIKYKQRQLNAKMPVAVENFDIMFKDLNRLKPALLIPSKENGSNWEGYFGFISIYRKGIAKQLLLTLEDFYLIQSDPPTPGRLAVIVDKVISNIPADSALIFTPCSSRPTKKRIYEIFGEAVSCNTNTSAGENCFGWMKMRVRFDDDDRVVSAVMPGIEYRYELAKILPTKSWLAFSRNKTKGSRVLNPNKTLGDGYVLVFEDDCVKIRAWSANTMTGYVPGFYSVTWK